MAQPTWLGKRFAAAHMAGMTKASEKPRPAEPPVRPGAGESRPAAPDEEIGGPKGPEPTRYGDWEIGGRCTDF
jgi:hypothetical protein